MIDFYQDSESGYDYGIIGKPYKQLYRSTQEDSSSNVLVNYKNDGGMSSVEVGNDEEFFVEVKYRKDTSDEYGEDVFMFNPYFV